MARVTYLPGVVPVAEVTAPNAEAVAEEETAAGQLAAEATGVKVLPTVWWLEETPVEAPSVTQPRAAGGDRSTGVDRPDRAGRAARKPAFIEEAEPDDQAMSEGERAAFLENIVVRALARKGLSEWEVSRLLTTNGVEQHELELFLDPYRQNRYIDDYDLAETLVESLHRRKGFGRSQIKAELQARHIQPEIVSAALEALDDDDELQRATELAEKRAPSLARLDAATAERRLTSFLMRKGYPSAIIRTAVSAALDPAARGVRFR